MPPERADLVLPTHIPDGERDILVFDGLNVETLLEKAFFFLERSNPNQRRTDCGDSGDDFTELELVENGGFTSGIKTDL